MTGRPRRCGWYDAVAVRYAVRVNGLDALALTKLDVLDGLPELQVCTSYRCRGATLTEMPGDLAQLAACEPVYETLPGWTAPTAGARRYDGSAGGGAALRRAARGDHRRAGGDRLHRLGARRHDHPRGFDRGGVVRASCAVREPASAGRSLRLDLAQKSSIAVGVGVGELDAGAIARRLASAFGSSNFAHATAPRKRITKSSFGTLTRTFWFGRRIVGGQHLRADDREIDDVRGIAIELNLDALPDAVARRAPRAVPVEPSRRFEAPSGAGRCRARLGGGDRRRPAPATARVTVSTTCARVVAGVRHHPDLGVRRAAGRS